MVIVKRVYEEPSKNDGYRVLVDRLWPRGVSKSKAELNEWLKEVAPSNGLREWFGHRPERFDAFREKYLAELKTNPVFEQLRGIAKAHSTITLLYGSHDPDYNQAVILRDLLTKG